MRVGWWCYSPGVGRTVLESVCSKVAITFPDDDLSPEDENCLILSETNVRRISSTALQPDGGADQLSGLLLLRLFNDAV